MLWTRGGLQPLRVLRWGRLVFFEGITYLGTYLRTGHLMIMYWVFSNHSVILDDSKTLE